MLDQSIAAVFAIVLFSSFMQTLTGFGYGLVAAPLLLFVLPPKEAIMLVLISATLQKVVLLVRTWREGRFADILLLFAASVAGAWPGSYILRIIDDTTIKLSIGLVLILAAAAIAADFTVTVRRPNLARIVTGLAAGFLGATTSFSGPPVMLYMLNEKQPKNVIRANLTRYFFLGNIATLSFAYYYGTLNIVNLSGYVAASAPALLIGTLLGDRLFYSLDTGAFRRIALLVISFGSISTIGSAIWKYLPK